MKILPSNDARRRFEDRVIRRMVANAPAVLLYLWYSELEDAHEKEAVGRVLFFAETPDRPASRPAEPWGDAMSQADLASVALALPGARRGLLDMTDRTIQDEIDRWLRRSLVQAALWGGGVFSILALREAIPAGEVLWYWPRPLKGHVRLAACAVLIVLGLVGSLFAIGFLLKHFGLIV
jgi:hypothetical protein